MNQYSGSLCDSFFFRDAAVVTRPCWFSSALVAGGYLPAHSDTQVVLLGPPVSGQNMTEADSVSRPLRFV